MIGLCSVGLTPTVMFMSRRWWMPPVEFWTRQPSAPTATGYEQLGDWLGSWGRVAQVGIEGTGSYGAGLTRHLISIGVEVAEVNRPKPPDCAAVSVRPTPPTPKPRHGLS